MQIKSYRNRADEIIAKINDQDHTQIPIDKFLSLEQLIGELSQNKIDFTKLRKYGCPSEYTSCAFACKGVKVNATPKMCSECWETALSETIYVDMGLDDTNNNKVPDHEDETEDEDEITETETALNNNSTNVQIVEDSELDYSDIIGSEPTGANYFSTAAQSIQEQFSHQQTKKESKFPKKPFFKKHEPKKAPEPTQITVPSEFDKLKSLGLTPEEIMKVFELLEWDIIKDFDLLCDILTK